MADDRTAVDVARMVADALDRRGLSYAVGGAIALAFYTAPRATIDVDVNVFVSPDTDLDRVLSALGEMGFVPGEDRDSLGRHARDEGQFRGYASGFRVDVFVPVIPYYAELETRRRQVSLLGRPLWILDANDLAVLKMMFFRRKDLADVEAILRDQGPSLDRAYVRRRLIELTGAGDERVVAWDGLVRDVAA